MQKQYLHFLLFATVIILFTSPFLISQDDEAAAKPLNGDDRCWGLNFKWERDFTTGKLPVGKLEINPSRTINSTGFGVDWYTSPKTSLLAIGSLGIGSETTDNTSGKDEFSQTEIGLKVQYNIYLRGMNKPVYYSFAPWASIISYSETHTQTPAGGTESKNEFSALTFGVGGNVSAYLKPWDHLNWEFWAGFNIGAFITPESTNEITSGGQTTEVKGPSRFSIMDCGGMVGTRFFFDSVNAQY